MFVTWSVRTRHKNRLASAAGQIWCWQQQDKNRPFFCWHHYLSTHQLSHQNYHTHVKCISLHCTSPQQGNECTCANSEVYWGRALFGVLQTSAYIQLRCVYKQNVLKDHGYSSPPTHTHAHTHRCSTFSMVNECNRLSCIIQLVQVPHTVHSGEKTKQNNLTTEVKGGDTKSSDGEQTSKIPDC